ncbi:MAG: DEAD/DEAH box helicase [Treponema sp.]|nr:DEAD/DEAH box helicase [Treponema sp.]
MKFTEFNLHPDLQKGIDDAGYTGCMPVQEQVLSHAFASQDYHASQDLYVQSQTGTGKTAAFLIVIYQRMLTEEALYKRKALIMAPTRELAVQIEEEAKMLGKYLPFKTGCFYGGVGYAQQEKMLKDNTQIMVGTPGRVLDLNKTGRMNLMEISFLVLDEADRMFDMGFYPDLRKLIKVVPSVDRRQTMLFSATLNAWVKNLAWEYTKTPFEIDIKPEIVTVEEITQILYHVPSNEKMPLLLGILKNENPQSAIIFCNTKKHTEITAKRLEKNGFSCEFIIGDLPQVKRLKIINDVKAGKTKLLVATDVAARGLDIDSLSMVINYDVPSEAENYVHRIGRTARAGKTGKAVTLASEQDVYELPAIERYIGKKIPSDIALREYYDEDRSAGFYIQTEFYEEHNIPKKPSRRDAETQRTHKGNADKRITQKRQTHGSRDTEKKENKNKQSPLSSMRSQRPLNHKPDSSAKGPSRSDAQQQDLSRLSMEERMALYKKKYAGTSAKHHHAGKQKPHKHHIEHEHEKLIKNESITEADITEKAPEKKGLITKILGLFKK